METTIELEKFIKDGFKLLRWTKDPSSVKTMLKHFEDAIQKKYGGKLQPTNAAKQLAVPTNLWPIFDLVIEDTEIIVDDESSSLSTSSKQPATSNAIVEVCSPPPPSIIQEQITSNLVENMNSGSEMETESKELNNCCVRKDSFVNVGYNLVECLNCRQRGSGVFPGEVGCASGQESKKSSSKRTRGAKSKKIIQ